MLYSECQTSEYFHPHLYQEAAQISERPISEPYNIWLPYKLNDWSQVLVSKTFYFDEITSRNFTCLGQCNLRNNYLDQVTVAAIQTDRSKFL